MLHNQRLLLLLGSLAIAPLAHSAETIFFEDFGCTGAAGTKSGGTGICTGGATTPKTWTSLTVTDGQGGGMYRAGPANGVNQIIRADDSTPIVTQDSAPVNFSVSGRNWDIHDGSQITQISGYRTPNTATNTNMQGNMLGHVVSSASLPSNNEDNYYQINGIQLNAKLTSIQLAFDFDSFIFADGDGFGVAISIDGGNNFDILNPMVGSAMTYRNLPTGTGDFSLDTLLGETVGAPLVGFDGSGNNVAGTAMFDLSGFANKTISLRFAYASVASDSGGSADGINIDNIRVTGVCTTGSGPNCTTNNNNAPEPASLGLALLGLTAASWRRRAKRA